MSTLTVDERTDFIDNLELADPATLGIHPITRGADAGPDYDKDAFVVLGATVTVTPSTVPGREITQQNKEDVLNSQLLAQLAATKKFDRETQAMEWYKAYRSVLENIGWVIKAYEFKSRDMRDSSFTADQVVLEVLKSIVSDDVLGLIGSTFKALKDLGEQSEPVKMFQSAAAGKHSGNFQAYPIYPDQLGVGMAFSGYEMVTTETVTSFLWFKWSSKSTRIDAAAQAVQLNEGVYSQVRAAVLAKLGKAASDFVDGIEI